MSRSSKRKPEARPADLKGAVFANALILGCLAFIAALQATDADLYYASLQEDEHLEWSTFWAFAVAGAVSVFVGLRQRRSSAVLPWFSLGLALFCVFVALEEISWGQRLLGYRPPVYFLEHNFQQEFNVHNIFDTDIRVFVLHSVILGYGVLLPVLGSIESTRKWLDRYGIIAPDKWLIPSFVATFALYAWYPWKYSGETVELMLGLGFLFATVISMQRLRGDETRTLLPVAGTALLVFTLGLANAVAARGSRAVSPELLEAAEAEAQALKVDFIAMALENDGYPVTNCNLHKRVYSFERKYEAPYLYKGRYAGLVERGMPEERASFFLDPWNSPYWIRDRCLDEDTNKRVIFVYSFGPNRRRDSSPFEVLGDDVGVYLYRYDKP